MTHSLNCLPQRPTPAFGNLHRFHEKAGTEVCICNFRTRETDKEEYLGLDQKLFLTNQWVPSLVKDPISKDKEENL